MIDFRMLNPPDVGSAFMRGQQQGRQLRIQGQTDSALSALAQNPQDEAAMSSLAAVDPDRAYQLGERNRQTQTRSALANTYNPGTGEIDMNAAAGVYAGQGDIEGALSLQGNAAEVENGRREQARAQAVELSRIIDGVGDQNSYQAALAAAARLGHDVSQMPQSYEEAIPELQEYQQILQISTSDDPTSLMQNIRYLVEELGVPIDQARAAALQNVARPVIMNTPGGGAGVYTPPVGGAVDPNGVQWDDEGGSGGDAAGGFPGQ